MPYQQTVEQHHRLTYRDNTQMVAQQMQNPLRAAVTIIPVSGEAHSMADLIGKTEYIEGEDYSRRNPDNPPKKSRRWLMRPPVIETGQYITKEEKFDQTQDMTSMLVRNQVATVERGVFDRILGVQRVGGGAFQATGTGIMGRAVEGGRPGAPIPMPSGNYIAVDYGNTGSPHGLTAVKLRGATEAMELEDFGLETDDEIFGLITPKQKTDLINLALATKASLNPFEVENIRQGKPGQLLGINWLFSNRVPKDSDGYRLIPIWSKNNIVVGMWQDQQGEMWNDTSSKNRPYIYNDAYVDCGRVEDGGVRIIRCNEA